MEFIDKNGVIKAYDISNVYLPGYILMPCNKQGDIREYDGYDQIHYTGGKILGYPFNASLRKLEHLSAYYKIIKKEAEEILI